MKPTLKEKKQSQSKSLTEKQKRTIRKQFPHRSAEEIAKNFKVSTNVVENYIHRIKPSFSKGKILLFRIVLILFSFLLIGLVELGLRIFNYGGELNLFLQSDFNPAYMIINRNAGARFFFEKNVNPVASYNVFLKDKPPNSYRIFVLGGSSAAGYPYLYNGAFSQMLKTRLEYYFPQKEIEMINVAMPAVNSFTLLDFTQEIVDWQPDAMLIYAGHNEFYGALGAGSSEYLGQTRTFVNFYLKLQKYRTILVLRNFIYWVRGKIQPRAVDKISKDRNLMQRMAADQQISYRGEKYLSARANFKENLRDIISIAKKNGAKVLIGDLVSNVREHKPFVSLFSENTDKSAWNNYFEEGQQLQNSGHYQKAVDRYKQALEVDDQPAIIHFRIGQCLDKLGHFEMARQSYYKAKALDALRFRASEDFNETIYELCAETNTPLAPVKSLFEQHSQEKLIGLNLMLEHLHPNLEDYFLMSKAFCQSLRENACIEATWDDAEVKTDSAYWQETGVTELDQEVALMRVKMLTAGWPFKPEIKSNPLSVVSPQNYIQNLALDFWQREITWERAHVLLAKHFIEQGKLDSAAMEYKALIKYTPINASPYIYLAKIYLLQKKFDELQSILLPTLELEPTAFAHKWIGIVYLNNNKVKPAVNHLEKAFEMEPKDLQIMYNLCGAYALDGNLNKSKELTEQLLKLAPDYPGAKDLMRQLKDKI